MIALVNGNTFRIPLRDKSVHCIALSPPYYGLRLYPVPPLVFCGEHGCEHEWGNRAIVNQRGSVGEKSTLLGGLQAGGEGRLQSVSHGQFCIKCGAWRGHFGNEPLHDCLAWARGEPTCSSCYVCHSRMYAAECWRVLRDDGVMFVNLGDSYAGSNKGVMADGTQVCGKKQSTNAGSVSGLQKTGDIGLKPKDLIGIPWRVALALQSDGWYLRQDIIWAKSCSGVYTGGSTMPESVKDRCVKAHEYVFLLSKSRQYYFDHIAIQEESQESSQARQRRGVSETHKNIDGPPGQTPHSMAQPRNNDNNRIVNTSRNRRSVWTVNPAQYSGAHYATWPPDLVEPMIKAGTSEHGCCPKCGAPWERIIEKGFTSHDSDTDSDYDEGTTANRLALLRQAARANGEEYSNSDKTIGWQPTCGCDAGDPIPCTVLDPFVGSGTTLVKARELCRSGIGIDLSFQYLRENARTRLELDKLDEWENGIDASECELSDLPLFADIAQ